MANKILIYLQSVISCFLKPSTDRQVAVVQLRDSTEATLQHVLKDPLSSVLLELLPKQVGVLLILIFFVPRIRPMKTVSTGQVFSRFSSRL